jgi:hypothetical protein
VVEVRLVTVTMPVKATVVLLDYDGAFDSYFW